MRSTKFLLIPAIAALALSGCKKEGVEGPLAGCLPVNGYYSSCTADAQCCSFGCQYGRCVANPVEGGICATHGDCQSPLGSPRLCVGGRCATVPGGCISGLACAASAPCCTGSCTNGLCPIDNPPIAVTGPDMVVPFRIPILLENHSYDPDTMSAVGVSYTWEWLEKPVGSTAAFTDPYGRPDSTWSTPKFTPDLLGTYRILLTAWSAGRHGATDEVDYTAVNTPPEIVAMDPDILGTFYQSRNGVPPLTTTASVADADGGPVYCTWFKKGPTDPGYTQVSNRTTCAAASGARATGTSMYPLSEDQAGTWEIRLTVDDTVNTFSKSRFVNVQNDAPVLLPEPSTAKMATRYGNVGSTDLVPLKGSVYDKNGDTVTWQWSMTGTKPVGSTAARFVPVAGNQQNIDFVPDKEGLYTLNLHVDDGHGGTADKAVDVIVGPYVLPLGHVYDAAFAAAKLIMIGDDAGAGRLWIVDPAVPAVTYTVNLDSLPTALGVSADGTQAVVARAGAAWDLVNLTTGTPSGAPRTGLGTYGGSGAFDASSVAWANGRVYVTSAGGRLRRLLLSATAIPYDIVPEQPASFTLDPSTRAVGSATYLWLLGSNGSLTRCLADNNDQIRDPVKNPTTGVASASGMWLSATSADLFFGGKLDVHEADSIVAPYLAYLGVLPAVPTHVGTMDDGGTLVGVISQVTSTSLTRFSGTGFTETTPALVIPFIGELGERRDPEGRFAFVTTVGGVTTYYAIVAVDRGTPSMTDDLWGLFTIVPAP